MQKILQIEPVFLFIIIDVIFLSVGVWSLIWRIERMEKKIDKILNYMKID